KDGPHREERQVLNLGHAARLARKDQLAHRYAARVEAHHERIDRAGRHESLRTFDVRDHLRQRLAHVRARMEEELEQRDVLDRARFDMLNAGDVEEVILVIRREKALHLRRVHPAVRLRDVDHRQIEVREDVYGHSRDCKDRPQGYADDGDENGEWTSEVGIDKPHNWYEFSNHEETKNASQWNADDA